jgi:hypothetical protein
MEGTVLSDTECSSVWSDSSQELTKITDCLPQNDFDIDDRKSLGALLRHPAEKSDPKLRTLLVNVVASRFRLAEMKRKEKSYWDLHREDIFNSYLEFITGGTVRGKDRCSICSTRDGKRTDFNRSILLSFL